MTIRTKPLTLLTAGTVLGVSLTLGHGVVGARDNSADVLPLDQLRTFSDIFARVKRNYVEEVSDEELLEHAIRGMLSGLDPHSAYLNTEQFNELRIGTSGEFGGLGIEVGMEDGFVKVVSPIDDTPAQRAGMQTGDLIIRLDDKPVKGLTLNEAVKLMRGRPGSTITLTVVREGEDKPLKVDITRAVIQVTSVRNRILEDNYGYVRVSHFQTKTPKDTIKAIESMSKELDGDLKGLVLDLRNNPGGVLSAAVGISDAFLDKGLIVYTDGRESDSRLRYSATKGDVLNGAPLVVLVNGGSAHSESPEWRRGQADYSALLHSQRQIDSGRRHRTGYCYRQSATDKTRRVQHRADYRVEPVWSSGKHRRANQPERAGRHQANQSGRGRLSTLRSAKSAEGPNHPQQKELITFCPSRLLLRRRIGCAANPKSCRRPLRNAAATV